VSISANLKKAVFDRETVTIAGGYFGPAELAAAARKIDCHDELLAALEACACFWGSAALYDSPVAQQARAAIAKATGQ